MTPPPSHKPRPLARKVSAPPRPVSIPWPITIYVCNVCHGVNSHPIMCFGDLEPHQVVPVEAEEARDD